MSLFKGLFSQQPQKPKLSHGELRAQKMEKRLENFRKGAVSCRDAQIRGTIQAGSARDYITKSLGSRPGDRKGATSVGRLGGLPSSGPLSSSGPALPPRLPPFRGK